MNITRQLHTLITQLSQLLDSRTLTERALIFITASLFIYMLVIVAIISPIERAIPNTQQTIAHKQIELKQLDQELQILMRNLGQAPKETAIARLKVLKNELKNTGKFSELMNDLIPPREMVRFVDGVLSSHKDIEVVRAKNMPAIQLWPVKKEAVANESAVNESDSKTNTNTRPSPQHKDEFTIYKHGMLLEVKGRYRDLVSFLAALEKLPWKILWDEVSLKSDEGDHSISTLMIYTLNPEKEWLGL